MIAVVRQLRVVLWKCKQFIERTRFPGVRGGLRDCYTMTAVKSLNRMSQVWDNSTVSAVQCWGLAQSVEHAAVNRSVVGSNPTFPVSLSATGSPERQGVRQHNVH